MKSESGRRCERNVPADPAFRPLRGDAMSPLFRTRILSAAVAAIPLLGWSAFAAAQYRVGDDGRALDANNRVGSNGHNPSDSNLRTPDQATGNDLVTGNVT